MSDQSNWTQVFYDGFNDGVLDRWKWPIVYGGSQYWNNAFWWDAKALKETNNELVVSAMVDKGRWIAGGTSTMRWDLNRADGFDFQYGRVEIRAAVDAGKGTGPAMLLWPFDNRWPPEVDILETPDAQRRSAWFTNHWQQADGKHAWHSEQFRSVDSTPYDALGTPYDGRAWHTYTLDWLPDRLIYYIDGVKLYETPPGEPVPHIPMALGLQMFVAAKDDGWYGGGPDRTTPRQVNLHVDYVKVYESDVTASPGDRTATAQASRVAMSEVTGEGIVRGTPGNEVLRGAPGADLFVPGRGQDRVPDFVPGLDRLQLSGAPEQVKTFIAERDGVEGLVVLYDGLNTVFLAGAQMRGLAADDMVFG